ncbi:hypothetical protein CHISP_0575 [Chitinispirillum alkaliphilum]|nr:hypothetical protein CHISP_0575 [Chitinispirillum alkaliphilum]
MKIIVDADACPRAIKDILFRAAQKAEIETVLVANTHIRTPPSSLFTSVTVSSGFNDADDRIVELVGEKDLVITADIPLASRVIEKGAVALDPRGQLYTEENVGSRLSVRDFMEELRYCGVNTGGPAPLGPRDRQNFANQLQKFLNR